ncbi:MAG: BMP family protein [Candidatus Erginobacter occultus]|nr:BMP family protein [Candidatus Erginobacter occultus]
MNKSTQLTTFRLGLLLCLLAFFACGRPDRYGDRIKVAGVYPGSRDSPRTAVVHRALEEADREMLIIYESVEYVSPREMERVLIDYVDKGYDLIFGDDRGAEEIVRRVARDHPETAFCFNSRLGSVDPNFSVFSFWIYEPAYLCGRLAGTLSESGRVAAVAADPHPALNASLNAFREGVGAADPDVRVEIVYAGQGKVAAETARLIEEGADYIFAGDPAAIAVCREKRVPAFGHLKNWYAAAPGTMVTGAVWDMGPTVEKVVEDVKNDRYRARDLREWSMMAKGGAYLAPYHTFESRLPFRLREEIDEIRRSILSGLYRVPADETLPGPD